MMDFLSSLGTPFQGATLLTVLMAVLVWWIRGIPDRHRAKNEEKQINHDASAKVITEYADRYKETRVEVHGLRNDLQVIQAELRISAEREARNKTKFDLVLFILRLVTTELRRIQEDNPVLQQATELLSQLGEGGGIADMESATAAIASAKATVVAAKETLAEVKKDGE